MHTTIPAQHPLGEVERELLSLQQLLLTLLDSTRGKALDGESAAWALSEAVNACQDPINAPKALKASLDWAIENTERGKILAAVDIFPGVINKLLNQLGKAWSKRDPIYAFRTAKPASAYLDARRRVTVGHSPSLGQK